MDYDKIFEFCVNTSEENKQKFIKRCERHKYATFNPHDVFISRSWLGLTDKNTGYSGFRTIDTRELHGRLFQIEIWDEAPSICFLDARHLEYEHREVRYPFI